jgi:hypothetical protein
MGTGTGLATSDARWFGGGYIYGTQNLIGGVAPSILLPSQFATIQEASVDFAITEKELRGSLEDPEDVASSTRKITGKIITGRVNITQLNNLAFGETMTTGTLNLAVNEAHTIPASAGPYTVTVNQGTAFYEDKGVTYAGTRFQMIPVTSLPAQGQYSYNAATGVYTFNGNDFSSQILISYLYTVSTGHSFILNNKIQGSSTRPVFECLLQNPNDSDQELLLYYCKVMKIAYPIKNDDYVKLELDFISYANASGQTARFLSSY